MKTMAALALTILLQAPIIIPTTPQPTICFPITGPVMTVIVCS